MIHKTFRNKMHILLHQKLLQNGGLKYIFEDGLLYGLRSKIDPTENVNLI